MSLLGIESLVYGVDDLETCARFYDDFGLSAERRDARGVDYRLPEGSTIKLRMNDDPALPARFSQAPGVREVIWGVDSEATLRRLAETLGTDRTVTLTDGTLRTLDDQGIPIGFRIFKRQAVEPKALLENCPGKVVRWNQHRAWYKRAQPKIMHHAVLSVPDIDKAVAFYTGRLGFRITDVSRGLGVFMRCDGRNDHHNLFFLRSDTVAWHHVSFGVDSIDEVMTGADHMQRQGWKSDVGIGRHRISSTLFYYIKNPAGGQSEYSADTDYLTDDWKPRLWEPKFGNFHWVGSVPEMLMTEPEWDVRVIEGPMPTFSELSRR
jgi:catechol 2,3-dioxygenase-like lactoylglutathione lyase family enzyme